MRLWKVLSVFCISAVLFTGCNLFGPDNSRERTASSKTVSALSASADSVLAELINYPGTMTPEIFLDYIRIAEELYQAALTSDPNDTHAAFGAAMTGFQRIMDDTDISTVRNILRGWDDDIENATAQQYLISQFFLHGVSGFEMGADNGGPYELFIDPGHAIAAMINLVQNSLSDPSPVVLVQTIITRSVIPAIDNTIQLLDKVTQDPGFAYNLTPEMTGMDENIKLDHGEAYLLKAMMHLVRGSMKIMTAYDVTIPGVNSPVDFYTAERILPLIKNADVSPSSNFLKLRNNDILPSAKNDFLECFDMINAAVNSILAETEDQTEHLIKKDFVLDGESEIANMTEDDWNNIPIPVLRNAVDINDVVNRVKQLLQGPFTVESDRETITVDLSAFFDNCIPDIKAILPYREWADLTIIPRKIESPFFETDRLRGEPEIRIDLSNLFGAYYGSIGDWGPTALPNTQYLGNVTKEGHIILTHTWEPVGEWDFEIVPLPLGANLTDDSEIYVDPAGRLCMSLGAFNKLNAFLKDPPRESQRALDLLKWTGEGLQNFSVNSPLGTRSQYGVITFAMKSELDHGMIMWLIDEEGHHVDDPVFPDETFGGILPETPPPFASRR